MFCSSRTAPRVLGMLISALGLLVAVGASARSAAITCENPQERIPTTLRLVAPLSGEFSPATGGQLAWIDVLWLADEQTDRLREYVTVDWRDRSVSQVQRYDVSLGGQVEDGVAPAAVVDSTDFDSGRVDLDFCMPFGTTHGLAVAYYEMDYDKTGKPQLAGAAVSFETDERPRYFQTTNRTGRWVDIGFSQETVFSTGQSSDRMLAMVEGATGSPPPFYLGGSLVVEAMSLRDATPARFIAPQDGRLAGQTFTVTGPEPSLLASNWVTSVRFRGQERLDSDGILRDLSPAESPLEVILGEESGAPRFLLHVVDGRLDIEHEPFECPGSSGTIRGVSRGNPLETGLRYFRGLSTGFAPIEAGRFELTNLACPGSTDQTLVTVTGTLGDQTQLAIDARPGEGSQAHLCARFSDRGAPDCTPITVMDVTWLFGLGGEELAGGETINLFCRPSRGGMDSVDTLSLIHISEPTRPFTLSRMPSSA